MRLQQQIRKADDGRQHVVEVVRDAARQIADGFHLLGLRNPVLELLLLGRIDDVERRRGTTRHGGKRRHEHPTGELLLIARRDLDRLHVSAPGEHFGEAFLDARALASVACTAQRFASQNVLRRSSVEHEAHEGSVAACDPAFAVDRRDAERRRLEELRSANVLRRAISETGRQTVDGGDRETFIGMTARRFDEKRQRHHAAVLPRQVEIDDALIGFRYPGHVLEEARAVAARKFGEAKMMRPE